MAPPTLSGAAAVQMQVRLSQLHQSVSRCRLFLTPSSLCTAVLCASWQCGRRPNPVVARQVRPAGSASQLRPRSA